MGLSTVLRLPPSQPPRHLREPRQAPVSRGRLYPLITNGDTTAQPSAPRALTDTPALPCCWLRPRRRRRTPAGSRPRRRGEEPSRSAAGGSSEAGPGPPRCGGAEEEEVEEGPGCSPTGSTGRGPQAPLPGRGAVRPSAGHLRRWQQHGHLRHLDEAQAVVDADTQPPLLHRQRAAGGPGAHLPGGQEGSGTDQQRPCAHTRPQSRDLPYRSGKPAPRGALHGSGPGAQ